jgi:hypothetical protein
MLRLFCLMPRTLSLTLVMHNTRFRFDGARKALILENVNCIGYTSLDDASLANDVEVLINFTMQENMFLRHHALLYAHAPYTQVVHPSSRRSRLCGWSSSSTRSNTQHPQKKKFDTVSQGFTTWRANQPHAELPLNTRQASTVYTEHFRVCDAEVSIRENTTTSRFRLTIVSQDGLTIVSQEREFLSLIRPRLYETHLTIPLTH